VADLNAEALTGFIERGDHLCDERADLNGRFGARSSGRRSPGPAPLGMSARFRLLPDDPLEVDIHDQCARVLDRLLAPPAMWCCYPAGGTELSPQQWARYARMGLKRGMPDLFVFYDGLVVMCDDLDEWERLKVALCLQPVRRGGYKQGSDFDHIGTQRVVKAADLLKRIENVDRGSE
jgi:hypothetical protein